MSARLRNVPALARVRLAQTLRGTVSNLVKVKPSAEDPEAPMPGARVRLHRLIDGVHDWQGVSAADGSYRASGLRAGLSYVPVAIDPSDTYECVASGPVLAAAAARIAPVARAIIGQPYAAEMRVLDAASPITSVAVSGTLPTGLSRDGLSLFGDWPTGAPGSYPLTLTIGQGAESMELPVTLDLVLLPLQIKASSPVPAMIAKDAAITPIVFIASGGEGPCTFDTTGTLPSGLSLLDNEDGTATLSGTPDTADTYSFAVRVTDVRTAQTSLSLLMSVQEGDPYVSDVVLLAPFTEDLIDLISGTAFTSGGSSGLVDGGPLVGTKYANTAASTGFTHTIAALGSGPVTIEAYVSPVNGGGGDAYGRMVQIGNTYTDGALTYNRVDTQNPSGLMAQIYNGGWGAGGAMNLGGTSALANNAFSHVALTRDGSNVWRSFVDGVEQSTHTPSAGHNLTGTTIYLGRNNSGSEKWNGGIAWLRITKACRYDADFTPPTLPMPLF